MDDTFSKIKVYDHFRFFSKIEKNSTLFYTLTEPSKILDSELENPSSTNMKDEVLLFQTGYLTIESIETIENNKFYSLKLPNFEVKSALFENLVNQYSNISYYDFVEYVEKILKFTTEKNCEMIKKTLGDYLSPIPYELRGDDEKYYHALIFELLYTARLHVHAEVHSNKGSADLVIEEEDNVIIIDFKQTKTSSIDYMIKKGFEQIEKKEYSRQYKNKKIIKGVIVFKNTKIGCKIIKE
jgi:ATP-dependent exoDNAse (exonuclease V) beta subunit